jgi:hypothetical protein
MAARSLGSDNESWGPSGPFQVSSESQVADRHEANFDESSTSDATLSYKTHEVRSWRLMGEQPDCQVRLSSLDLNLANRSGTTTLKGAGGVGNQWLQGREGCSTQ